MKIYCAIKNNTLFRKLLIRNRDKDAHSIIKSPRNDSTINQLNH